VFSTYSRVQLSHISLIQHDEGCEVTKSGVARPTILISIFYARLNCENLSPKILRTVLVHICLKTATTKIKTLTIKVREEVGKIVYQNSRL
jgi:hypothetical protein